MLTVRRTPATSTVASRFASSMTSTIRPGIDRRSGAVLRAGRMIELHRTSYEVLLALAEAYPRTLTRSELISLIWPDEVPDSDPLRSHVYMLRQALDKPFDRPMVQTVHGVGLRLVADE
jgi:DNA-binding winged helix-turn-helix (wHTH) protein